MDKKNNKLNQMYEDINYHILNDTRPSIYIESLDEKGELEDRPFNMLSRLKKVEQSKKYHPEGNVWKHTMLVLNEAAKVKEKSSDSNVFMWGALLHDIGKFETTKYRKDKITSYDHDKVGAKRVEEFLEYFQQDTEYIKKVAMLVKYHMYILYVVKDLPFADLKGLRKETNIDDIALLGLCDRLGRGGADEKLEEENIRLFLKKAKNNK
ncbi:HDIG domain-containing metalloprotein [Anaeromicropila herbilytica]|uniref:Phosphohydrolase n=1 Tax=Anaeromicropila herbilytica TaxID=2785025 RepID=A0A7R7IDM1_9FIRM|nr:HDIG domain-containing metalloprotein [Anaeromicropila herbilytica]BCN31219.1 phosphohydrolase [Anaeromicropila herbilytica]